MIYYKCGEMFIWTKGDLYYENMGNITYVYNILDLDFNDFFKFHSKKNTDTDLESFYYFDKYEEVLDTNNNEVEILIGINYLDCLLKITNKIKRELKLNKILDDL
jgi:hypothetical protein